MFLEEASGTYEVRVVQFLVTQARADGVAAFESVEGGRPPNPSRSDGGRRFGPSTIVDLQRTEGEPLNFIHPGTAAPRDSAHWESGPVGTTTQQSWIHRSVDDGDQFNVVSPVGLRPNPPPGGGDTDIVVDDQGVAYWTDLEALVNLDCSVSNDGGNSWRKTSACVPTPGVDRQWFAVDDGVTTPPAPGPPTTRCSWPTGSCWWGCGSSPRGGPPGRWTPWGAWCRRTPRPPPPPSPPTRRADSSGSTPWTGSCTTRATPVTT